MPTTSAASGKHSPRQNHLLAALPATDYERLLPDLELVPLPLGWAVYEAGGPQGYVYFPTTSIVSLLYVMEDGSSAEIEVTGNDGLIGIALFMGGETFAEDLEGPAAAYSISKAALNALTLRLSREVRRDVKVNAVCPGWVRTRMGGPGATVRVQDGADTVVWLATLPPGGPNGGFFRERRRIPW